jgi:hypothetical protein
LNGVRPEAKAALYNTWKGWSEQTGKQDPLSLNSAYRSPAYNEALRRRSSGVAKNSRHMQGDAFDVSVRGMPREQQQMLLDQARANGFRGFGFYPDSQFIHMDQGSAREWGNKRGMGLTQIMQQQPPALQQAAGLPIDPIDPYRQMIAQNLGMV